MWEKVWLLLTSPSRAGFDLLQHFGKGVCKASWAELCVTRTFLVPAKKHSNYCMCCSVTLAN